VEPTGSLVNLRTQPLTSRAEKTRECASTVLHVSLLTGLRGMAIAESRISSGKDRS